MYPVVELPLDAPDRPEQLGTKEKFWYDNDNSLFKAARSGTGEDWSEKAACELCALLGIPHALYDLATWDGRRGVTTCNIKPVGGSFIPGNQVLVRVDPKYPSAKRRGVRQHTLRGVLAITNLLHPPIGFQTDSAVRTATDVFIGYLMLDALISNQDRHHENWGLVMTKERVLHLAPTFDHASSFAPFISDAEKSDRLTTRDKPRSVESYVEKARSALFLLQSSTKPLTTIEAFLLAARLSPQAGLSWLKRLQNVSMDQIEDIFRKIPGVLISDISINFSLRMVSLNRSRLFNLLPDLMS